MKCITVVLSVLLSIAVGITSFAFPKGDSGKEPQIETGQTTQPAQQPQPSQEELEKMKKGMEEAKKIVVAKVNGVNITMDSVINVMNRIAARRKQGDPLLSNIEAIKKDALDRIIFQELAYQKAKAEGVTADPVNVANAMDNLKINLGSEDSYKKFLENQMVTEEELKSQVGKSLILEIIFAKEINDKIVIPEDEVRKEYEKEKSRYITPEKAIVTDVVFFLKTDDKDSIKKAKAILKKIQEDKNKDPWRLVLDGTFSVRTLEIKKDKHKELYDEARKLKTGELSGVIKTSESLHILKLKEYSPEKQLSLDEVRESLEGKFRMAAQEKRMKEFETELRRNAKIEIIETESSKQKTEDTKDKDKESTQKSEDKKQ
ncbi:MAG: peptidyl-prolyl cis-trans isomerase [Nitrospirae bacterium]|nr:peptidyl-prolyl cis-trans isomerase [Nitrospirota bacterium]